ncbi:MAG: hypothetical protein M3Q83_04085 [Pseudomonadota bacterium]|nr:hypothetical protein [Pseudomonadota bacterium]
MSVNQSDTTASSPTTDSKGSRRERAVSAYDSARERASSAKAKTGNQIDEAPLIALAGGLAAGALIAALLPRTTTEDKLLGPVGEKITGGARSAIDAAKQAGRDKFEELNLTRDAGASAFQTIIKGVSDAAAGSVRRKD